MDQLDISAVDELRRHYEEACEEVTSAFHSDGWNDSVNESFNVFLNKLYSIRSDVQNIASGIASVAILIILEISTDIIRGCLKRILLSCLAETH